MKKLTPLLVLITLSLTVSVVYASPEISLSYSPEVEYDQLWAYETYTVNLTVSGVNITGPVEFGDEPVTPTGRIIIEGEVIWRRKGQYYFGSSTSSYSAILEVRYHSGITKFGHPYSFNVTVNNDAYDYGFLPLENIEISVKTNVYYEVLTLNGVTRGPLIGSKTVTMMLIDEMKASYLEGKLLEITEEVSSVINIEGLEIMDVTPYSSRMEDFNASISRGDYAEAGDIWRYYDSKYRFNMLSGLAEETEYWIDQNEPLLELQDSYDTLQSEYNGLELAYSEISKAYLKTNSELNSVKTSLSTAITGIFLAAIIFFFLGRRTLNIGD